MAMKDDIKTLIKALDDATNAIAARIDALAARIPVSGRGLTAEEAQEVKDGLTAEVAKLQALGADPNQPVPGSEPAPQA